MDDNSGGDRRKSFTEEIEVAAKDLVGRVDELIKEGNVRLLRIRSEKGDVFLELPLTVGAVTGGVVALAAPWLAVLGAVTGLVARVKIEIVRVGDTQEDDEEPWDGPRV
ncbi:MAG TPA: DUF4342 domain-containing protein [Devosiaceae bacterium]|nr:DUF4342 domain-containing protein [Devosiaceae bacterium]